jgi:hypothetical protein
MNRKNDLKVENSVVKPFRRVKTAQTVPQTV